MKEAIRKGRFEFLTQFPSIASEETQKLLPAPDDPDVFARCKLDFSERQTNRSFYDLHADLIKLRQDTARFCAQDFTAIDGAVLGPASFVLRYFAKGYSDCLLVVNLGRRLKLQPIPEPLLAPPLGFEWKTVWTSESPRYGGPGTSDIVTEDRWMLPAESAVALRLVPETKPRRKPKRRIRR